MKNKLFIICILSFVLGSLVFALETKESLDIKITSKNQEIETIDKEIAKYEKEIEKTTKDKNTLSNLIKELTLTKAKLLKESQRTKKKIIITEQNIDSLDKDIAEKTEKIELAKKVMASSINEIYKINTRSIAEELLSIDNLQDVSKEYNNRLNLSKELLLYVGEIRQAKEELTISKRKVIDEQNALQNLKKDIDLKKQAVEATTSEKNKLLKETKNKESAYQKMLAENRKKREAFEKELRDYESQLQFVLNQKLLPGKGVLSWPLDNVFITQLFGKTSSSGRLYSSGSHSGIDLRASIGTNIYSMGTGTVEGIGDTDDFCKGTSFGKWVFIRYNNGLASTFGHLSSIKVNIGDRVEKGTLVGLSGNSGHSTGPHLHITVYAGQGAKVETLPSKSCAGKKFIMPVAPTNAYLDPLIYLPYTTSSMYKNDSKRD